MKDLDFQAPGDDRLWFSTSVAVRRKGRQTLTESLLTKTPRDLWRIMWLSLSIFPVSVHLGKFSFYKGGGGRITAALCLSGAQSDPAAASVLPLQKAANGSGVISQTLTLFPAPRSFFTLIPPPFLPPSLFTVSRNRHLPTRSLASFEINRQ